MADIPRQSNRRPVVVGFVMLTIALSMGVLIGVGVNRTRSSDGPSTVSADSSTGEALSQRIQFVEQYVTFRREYLDLEYSIDYQNNGGGWVSGPSDWDVILIAVVPQDTIDDWVPTPATKTDTPSDNWAAATATKIAVDGIDEWYSTGNVIVGIDREAGVIAYRNSTM